MCPMELCFGSVSLRSPGKCARRPPQLTARTFGVLVQLHEAKHLFLTGASHTVPCSAVYWQRWYSGRIWQSIRGTRLLRIRKDIIVIGATVGGIEALNILVTAWPGDLEAAVFIALHVA
jgi:hypothetical protein